MCSGFCYMKKTGQSVRPALFNRFHQCAFHGAQAFSSLLTEPVILCSSVLVGQGNVFLEHRYHAQRFLTQCLRAYE